MGLPNESARTVTFGRVELVVYRVPAGSGPVHIAVSGRPIDQALAVLHSLLLAEGHLTRRLFGAMV